MMGTPNLVQPVLVIIINASIANRAFGKPENGIIRLFLSMFVLRSLRARVGIGVLRKVFQPF
jgi:hypothetical protein